MKTPSSEMHELFESSFDELRKERSELIGQHAQLVYKERQFEKKLDDLAYAVGLLIKKTREEVLEIFWNKESPMVRYQMTIPQAMVEILKKYGAMTQKDLIEKIRESGVRISVKAPYVVIGNTLRRDKEKRFYILNDGRVDLIENKKGNHEIARSAKADVIRKRKGGV